MSLSSYAYHCTNNLDHKFVQNHCFLLSPYKLRKVQLAASSKKEEIIFLKTRKMNLFSYAYHCTMRLDQNLALTQCFLLSLNKLQKVQLATRKNKRPYAEKIDIGTYQRGSTLLPSSCLAAFTKCAHKRQQNLFPFQASTIPDSLCFPQIFKFDPRTYSTWFYNSDTRPLLSNLSVYIG